MSAAHHPSPTPASTCGGGPDALESWQVSGVNLLLLAKFFPKLRRARRAVAARKCVPNLDNLRAPLMVEVGVDVSTGALCRAAATAGSNTAAAAAASRSTDMPLPSAANGAAAPAPATKAEGGGAATAAASRPATAAAAPVFDEALNSRLFLCAGLPAELTAAVVLDVQVTMAHEGRQRPLAFARSLPGDVVVATEALADRRVSAAQLARALRQAYARAQTKASKSLGIREAAARRARARAGAVAAAAADAVEALESEGEHEAGQTQAVGDAVGAGAGTGGCEGEAVGDTAADNDSGGGDDDEAFGAMFPEASARAPGRLCAAAWGAARDAECTTHHTTASQVQDQEAEQVAPPVAPVAAGPSSPDDQAVGGAVVVPFPTGFSQPTAVAIEEYAAQFAAVLRDLMSGGGECGGGSGGGGGGGGGSRTAGDAEARAPLLATRRVVVVAFDAQQQELLETCFQAFFPVAPAAAQRAGAGAGAEEAGAARN